MAFCESFLFDILLCFSGAQVKGPAEHDGGGWEKDRPEV